MLHVEALYKSTTFTFCICICITICIFAYLHFLLTDSNIFTVANINGLSTHLE